MPDHPSRIKYLLGRYVNKSCSREELEELFSYIGKENNEELLHFMGEAYQANNTVPELDFNDIYAQIPVQTPVVRTGIFTFGRAAAAAVVLLLAGSAYWLMNKQPEKTIAAVQPVEHTDIAPGMNKAVLTLGDGSTVTLDSAGNQVIKQGIRKQNGQLLYSGEEDGDIVHYNKLSTPRGGQFKIVLPDGTKAWLNSASTLRYPTAFNGKDRTVELEGQAYFEVAKNATQPFKVMVDHMEVQVLGTDFDVMAYPDESTINTTLLSGSVQVKDGQTLKLLKPGQQALMSTDGITVKDADLKKVTAWKNGLFVFNNMALPAILREVARWYDIEIVYAAKPGEELYGGGIGRNLNLSGVLDLLEGNGYNHFRIEGRKVIVLP
jgi:ferric-dicitrate binding protein FerR (iron transport regulator)